MYPIINNLASQNHILNDPALIGDYQSENDSKNLTHNTITFKSFIKEMKKTFTHGDNEQLLGLSDRIDGLLKEYNIRKFEYLQIRNLRPIDSGGSAIVYSVYLLGQKYALKSLDVNANLNWDYKKFKIFLQETSSQC
ncbi:27114_t:CDS:2 [Dentiscutata erythropus]|uniref:27114_t:CDS:1 n=1 Tax=Dentiscutata erythropus TaxID=1348616 RepID=A0A9N9DCF9_9GLOM|nr:27114_t:CDS:2 [Dentiscutata erythropus]